MTLKQRDWKRQQKVARWHLAIIKAMLAAKAKPKQPERFLQTPLW